MQGKEPSGFFYEAGNTLTFYMDRSASFYERDMHITVELVGHNVSRPLLTGDQVITPSSSNPVIYSFKVSDTNVVTDDIGDLINGDCVDLGSSVNCTFNSGKIADGYNSTPVSDWKTVNTDKACFNYDTTTQTAKFRCEDFNSAAKN